MIESMIILIVVLALLVALKIVINTFRRATRAGIGIKGKLIWMDRGKSTKPFFNAEFRILGKPDLMYQIGKGILAVEYKSRVGKIYESDIAQATCAALAARGAGFRVTQILVKTSSQERYIALPQSDLAIHESIAHLVSMVREAKRGSFMAALPSPQKCRRCAYKLQCRKSAAAPTFRCGS